MENRLREYQMELTQKMHEKIFDRYGGALVLLVLLELNGMHIEASEKDDADLAEWVDEYI